MSSTEDTSSYVKMPTDDDDLLDSNSPNDRGSAECLLPGREILPALKHASLPSGITTEISSKRRQIWTMPQKVAIAVLGLAVVGLTMWILFDRLSPQLKREDYNAGYQHQDWWSQAYYESTAAPWWRTSSLTSYDQWDRYESHRRSPSATIYEMGVISDNGLTIQSPNWPYGSYDDNAQLRWLFRIENGKMARIQFSSPFRTEACCDKVYLIDGDQFRNTRPCDRSSYSVLGEFSGRYVPSLLLLNIRNLMVDFCTDHGVRDLGFQLTISTNNASIDSKAAKLYALNWNAGSYGSYYADSTAEYSQRFGVYDFGTQSWTRLAGFPPQRQGFSMVSLDDLIYVIGGTGWTPLKYVVYDPLKNEWSAPGPEMFEQRSRPRLAAGDGKIFVVGGVRETYDYYNRTVLVSGEVFDAKARSWTKMSNMKVAREGFGLVYLEGRLYAIGGEAKTRGTRSDGQPMSTVEKYDPKTNTWITASPLNVARKGHSVVVVGKKIYAIGGQTKDFWGYTRSLKSVEMFDLSSNSWKFVAEMSTTRVDATAYALNTLIYVQGESSYSREVYNTASDRWRTLNAPSQWQDTTMDPWTGRDYDQVISDRATTIPDLSGVTNFALAPPSDSTKPDETTQRSITILTKAN